MILMSHRCLKLTYHVVGVLPVCFLDAPYRPTELNGSETEWGDSETEAESDNTDIQQKARCTTTIIEISDDEEAPSWNQALRAPRPCLLMLTLTYLPQEPLPLQPPKAASKQSRGQKSRGLNSKLSSGPIISFRHKLPAAFRWTFSNGKRLPTDRKVTLKEVPVVPMMKRMFSWWCGVGVANSQGCN